MKTLILILAFATSFAIPVMAERELDYGCYQDCLEHGQPVYYCEPQCTYYKDTDYKDRWQNWQPSYPPIKQHDYKCVSDCTMAGYSYQFCESRCEY